MPKDLEAYATLKRKFAFRAKGRSVKVLFLSFNQSDSIVPNYEYECDGEGEVIVLDLPMDHKIPHCQVCNAPLRRVFTAVPTIFKGTGWAGKDG